MCDNITSKYILEIRLVQAIRARFLKATILPDAIEKF